MYKSNMHMRTLNRGFFINPTTDPDYSVSGFWFWNDHINDEQTTEQLGMMHRIHADQPVIHARSGLQNEYLSDDWFERIGHAITVARRLGQKFWLYDEKDWPSGNCAWSITKDEQYREHFLQFDEFSLTAGTLWNYTMNDKVYISAAAFSEDQTMQDLPCNGTAITLPMDVNIIAVYVDVDDYEGQGKYSIDYISRKAIRRFIESTHEKYKEHFALEFGNILTGIFIDETRFCNAMPWTAELPDEFIKRKGYDLVPFLPLLRQYGQNKEGNISSALVRFDYYDIISDLYAECTFKQIMDWCTENRLQLTGHLLGEETIAAQNFFGADCMRTLKYLHVPGIDHLGNGIGSLDAKFVVSAAHHYGKDRVSCEAFGASGWNMSYEDMVRISNWLFQQGINLIIMHGFYYSIRNERMMDFPPSYFFQWKHWDKMIEYVPMANRMMEMLSGGRREAEILVYAPMESFWTCVESDLSVKTFFPEPGSLDTPASRVMPDVPPCPPIKDDQARYIDNQFQMICNRLCDENLDYEILGDDAAVNFVVQDGLLVNKLNGSLYSVLVLPCVTMISETMACLLDAFTGAGGLVISYHGDIAITVAKDGRHIRQVLPLPDSTKFSLARRISDIVNLCHSRLSIPFEIIQGPERTEHSHSSYPDHLIDPYIHDGELVYGVGVSRYLKADVRIFHLTNYNNKNEDMLLWCESSEIPEFFMPETGAICMAGNARLRDGGYEFFLTLPANRSVFVVCPRG